VNYPARPHHRNSRRCARGCGSTEVLPFKLRGGRSQQA